MLAPPSDRVRMDLARRDGPKHTHRTAKQICSTRSCLFREHSRDSETGVVGHPDLATPQKGAQFFDASCPM